MKKISIAYQLYSSREDAAADFEATMRMLKDCGYDGVELAGFYGYSPSEVSEILKSTEINAVSAHVPIEEFLRDLNGTVRIYQELGCKYIVIPYLTADKRPESGNFGKYIGIIRDIGEACSRNGLTLLYHNHDFEFNVMEDNRYMLDYIYDEISPEYLKTELDTCWINVVGESPVRYIEKYSGRCPVVHLKDYIGRRSEKMYSLLGQEERDARAQDFRFTAIGYGMQDIPGMLLAAEKSGTEWVVVEQDKHYENSAAKDARLSIEYLRKFI